MANKLLALDQSSRITGWAIFENGELLNFGKFEFASTIPIDRRLYLIREKIKNLIEEYEISEVILEDIQLQNNVVNNVKTFKTLAEVFGVIVEMLYELKLEWTAVLASSWKATLGIKGANRSAQKKAAQQWVKDSYNISATQDECDAICIGAHKITQKKEVFDWSE